MSKTTQVPEEIHKAAVDALYAAREDGKVMDEAALCVAAALEPVLRKQWLSELTSGDLLLDPSFAEAVARVRRAATNDVLDEAVEELLQAAAAALEQEEG